MNKKQFLNGRLTFYENYLAGGDEKTATFAELREQLNKLETDEEYGLNDYKIFCFDGEPKLIQVDYSRFINHKRNYYTPKWEFINEKVAYENDPYANINKPRDLNEMLECARKLSNGFPHVRVDFYNINDRLVFGELTFYHGAGYLKFENEDFERKLGDYWTL